MSWAHIVGAQISKILDYRRGDLNSAPLELAVPGDMRSGRCLCAGTQGPTEGCPIQPLEGSSLSELKPQKVRVKGRGVNEGPSEVSVRCQAQYCCQKQP